MVVVFRATRRDFCNSLNAVARKAIMPPGSSRRGGVSILNVRVQEIEARVLSNQRLRIFMPVAVSECWRSHVVGWVSPLTYASQSSNMREG